MLAHLQPGQGRATQHAARLSVHRTTAAHEPGRPLTGQVELQLGAEASPRFVYVELQLVALGEVSSVAVAARASVDTSSWRPGGRYTAPFTLDVPTMPMRFAGSLFETEARVAVVVDALEGQTATAARAFPLATIPIDVASSAPLQVAIRAPSGRSVKLDPGVSVAIGAALLILGLLSALLAIALTAAGASLGWAFALVSASTPLLLLGGVILYVLSRRSRVRRKLGTPAWELEPGASGVRVTLKVAERTSVARAWLLLKIHENTQMPGRSEDGIGMGRDAEVARLRFDLVPVGRGRWCADLSRSTLASLPESLDLPGNHVYWFAEITVECTDGEVWSDGAQLRATRGERWTPLTAFWYE